MKTNRAPGRLGGKINVEARNIYAMCLQRGAKKCHESHCWVVFQGDCTRGEGANNIK